MPDLALLGIVLGGVGVSLFVLSDGRRGVVAGLLAAALGLALTQFAEGSLANASVTAVAGVLGALASLRGGDRPGWAVLPAGSTSRIVLCAVVGAAALWFGSRLLGAPGTWQSRAVAAILMALAGARALATPEIAVALPGASLVVLGAGALAAGRGGGVEAALLGGACAVLLNLVPWTFRPERESQQAADA